MRCHVSRVQGYFRPCCDAERARLRELRGVGRGHGRVEPRGRIPHFTSLSEASSESFHEALRSSICRTEAVSGRLLGVCGWCSERRIPRRNGRKIERVWRFAETRKSGAAVFSERYREAFDAVLLKAVTEAVAGGDAWLFGWRRGRESNPR